ncbi:MAG: hypothetical protein ACYSWP_03120 [Planctomycetota bacterium]|jgi:predicted RNA-binding Zn-ribbon protein involved in translation (DUF1610 family)
MNKITKVKGTWIQRFSIIFFSLVLGVLLFWLLGFITKDIGSLRGPDRSKVEAKYIDAEAVAKQKGLKENLDEIRRDIRNQQEQQGILKDSSNNLQKTINQLLSIPRKDSAISEENKQVLFESQKFFLENQRKYQDLSRGIGELTLEQQKLDKELILVSSQIESQRDLARTDYRGLLRKHRWKVAALKLAVMLPIFLIGAWFFKNKRSGSYGAIVYAGFIAVFAKIFLIVHEYFPRRYFKYIAIVVVILIVLKLLLYLLKRLVSPKMAWLIKQYQESYDRNICPICGKPIRIGPLRYASKLRRGVLVLAGESKDSDKQQVYSCPSCGTELYSKCDKCNDIRHCLLPFCEHCGDEKIESNSK